MKTELYEIIKTANTIVCMSGEVIKYAKCLHTGKFIKHSIAKEEIKEMFATNAKLNLSVVFLSLFVAIMFILNIDTIDIILSTLCAIGFVSLAIVLSNNKKDILLM